MSRLEAQRATGIVRDAGGRIVGRTRFQKLAYFLAASGLEDIFNFSYKHYGPFSDSLSSASREADLLGLLTETEYSTSWGGTYSVFQVDDLMPEDVSQARRQIGDLAVQADAVELELAATALFLAKEGFQDPWQETRRRKPEKSDEARLASARLLYQQFRAIQTPIPLPNIA